MTYYIFSTNIDPNSANKEILLDPITFLKTKMVGSPHAFGIDNLLTQGIYKYLGWKYDFRDDLKKFVYKQHGVWSEAYALNKTNLRHLVGGRIDKIIEL